jgi:phosphatidylinositol alpha-mannosyltransferase
MKIGIVTTAYYPYPGGVSEHVYNTYRQLKELGHDVRVVTTSFGRGTAANDPDVIRIGRAVSVPANGSICPVATGFRIADRVRRALESERFDVVHVHEPFMPMLCLSVLREANVPLVGTFHACNESALGYRLFRPMLLRYAERLTCCIAVSEAARRTAARHFDVGFSVIPNGVDVERFSLAEPAPELSDGRTNLLFVGRMEPRKGAKHLFRALPAVLEEVPDLRLTVVGGGPFLKYYRSFVPAECRGSVRFEGFVSSERLASHYASADIYCSPAVGGESFGIVLLEAMAGGAAIVASDISGYRDVVEHGRTGLLVSPGDPDDIARAIVRLARDSELRSALVANAREAVMRYSWDRVTREIVEVYEEAIGAGRSGTGRRPREADQTESNENRVECAVR